MAALSIIKITQIYFFSFDRGRCRSGVRSSSATERILAWRRAALRRLALAGRRTTHLRVSTRRRASVAALRWGSLPARRRAAHAAGWTLVRRRSHAGAGVGRRATARWCRGSSGAGGTHGSLHFFIASRINNSAKIRFYFTYSGSRCKTFMELRRSVSLLWRNSRFSVMLAGSPSTFYRDLLLLTWLYSSIYSLS